MAEKNKILDTLSIALILILSICISITTSLRVKSDKKISKFITSSTGQNHFDIDLDYYERYREFLEYFRKIRSQKTSLIQTGMNNEKDEALYKNKFFSSYIGNLYIGSPPQKVKVLFDTGSGYNWVTSKLCITNGQCGKENAYISNASSTYKPLPVKVKVVFGSGALSGSSFRDNVKISENITDSGEFIQEIENISDNSLFKEGASGLFGLAFNSTSLFNRTFFDGLVLSKNLTRNVIGFYFGKHNGQMNFGHIDESKYEGELIEHKVVDAFYWTIAMDDLEVANSTIGLCEGKNCLAIVDSGTGGITLPPKMFDVVTQRLNTYLDENLNILPKHCDNLDELPDLTFKLNNHTYVLNPSDYAFIVEEVVNILPFPHVSKICSLQIMPMDIPKYSKKGKQAIILGENFIRKFYTVFDHDNSSVHFALSKKN